MQAGRVPHPPDAERRGVRGPRWPRPWVGPVLLAALLAAALILAGCGGGGDSPAPTRRAAATAPRSTPRGGAGGAASLQQQFVRTIAAAQPSVVQIQTAQGLGSGVIMDARGDIVTNAHVVGSARSFTVTLADGKQRRGTLVGAFPAGDLAVIRVAAGGLRPLPLADSDALRVGAIVLAMGSPLGLRASVTDGIISALGRTVTEPGGTALPGVIQTSAPINPGNSGGALVDLRGRLVGIPTLAATDPELGGGAAPGIGFAIPSDTVRDIAGQIIRHGRVVNSHRAYLGVRVGATLGGSGVFVAAVTAGGPAARAGIREGDLILAVNGRPTPTPDELSSVLADLAPGRTVPVRIRRSAGGTATVRVTLGTYPGG